MPDQPRDPVETHIIENGHIDNHIVGTLTRMASENNQLNPVKVFKEVIDKFAVVRDDSGSDIVFNSRGKENAQDMRETLQALNLDREPQLPTPLRQPDRYSVPKADIEVALAPLLEAAASPEPKPAIENTLRKIQGKPGQLDDVVSFYIDGHPDKPSEGTSPDSITGPKAKEKHL